MSGSGYGHYGGYGGYGGYGAGQGPQPDTVGAMVAADPNAVYTAIGYTIGAGFNETPLVTQAAPGFTQTVIYAAPNVDPSVDNTTSQGVDYIPRTPEESGGGDGFDLAVAFEDAIEQSQFDAFIAASDAAKSAAQAYVDNNPQAVAQTAQMLGISQAEAQQNIIAGLSAPGTTGFQVIGQDGSKQDFDASAYTSYANNLMTTDANGNPVEAVSVVGSNAPTGGQLIAAAWKNPPDDFTGQGLDNAEQVAATQQWYKTWGASMNLLTQFNQEPGPKIYSPVANGSGSNSPATGSYYDPVTQDTWYTGGPDNLMYEHVYTSGGVQYADFGYNTGPVRADSVTNFPPAATSFMDTH